MLNIKKILAFMLVFNSMLLVANDAQSEAAKKRHEANVKAQMEEEQKFAREQTFYQGENYNLKGSEVNQDSVDSVPDIEVDPFNMDSVYD